MCRFLGTTKTCDFSSGRQFFHHITILNSNSELCQITNTKTVSLIRTNSKGIESPTMSNIRSQVRDILKSVLDAQDGENTRIDVLRVMEEEAMLMKETQYVADMLDSDPMEQFSNVKPQIARLKKILRVQSCNRVRVTNDYCKIDAVLGFHQTDNLELTFRYERKRRQEEDGRLSKKGFHIRYSIEMSINHQQRENLLVVEVWTPNDWPSIEKAVCINEMMERAAAAQEEDEEGGWEDIDEDEDEGNEVTIVDTKDGDSSQESSKKRPRLNSSQEETTDDNDGLSPATDEEDDDNDENEPDSYIAHLDPDVLHEFLTFTKIQTKNDDMNEGTAFFLLMTFPFYEHEWDLIGFVLEEIFGGEDDEE